MKCPECEGPDLEPIDPVAGFVWRFRCPLCTQQYYMQAHWSPEAARCRAHKHEGEVCDHPSFSGGCECGNASAA